MLMELTHTPMVTMERDLLRLSQRLRLMLTTDTHMATDHTDTEPTDMDTHTDTTERDLLMLSQRPRLMLLSCMEPTIWCLPICWSLWWIQKLRIPIHLRILRKRSADAEPEADAYYGYGYGYPYAYGAYRPYAYGAYGRIWGSMVDTEATDT